jgi:hypothetical protein
MSEVKRRFTPSRSLLGDIMASETVIHPILSLVACGLAEDVANSKAERK